MRNADRHRTFLDDLAGRRARQDSGRGGRPRGGTRERILDIALDLFTEHGYDKTSLREIADELGFTKAALYYHFERKEDILLALHLRLHALGHDVLERLGHLEEGDRSVDVFWDLLDTFIDEVLANRKLFLFHARNRNALEQIEHEDHSAEHEDLEQELRRLLANPAVPARVRVRMACAIGAVLGSIMGSGEVFADVDPDELGDLVRDAVGDLLRPAQAPPRRPRSRPPGGHRH